MPGKPANACSRGIALAILLLVSSAASAAPQNCALAGGASWREYKTEHFVIDAAGWDRDPKLLVAAFEDLYAAVLAALIAEPVEIPAQLRVIVLPRQRDLNDYTGSSHVDGLFWVSPSGEPLILISAEAVTDVPRTVSHELTHFVSAYLFPRQSFWFAEGLAQFLESVGKVDGDGKRWAGGDPEGGWAAGSIKLARAGYLLGDDFPSYGENAYLTSFVLYRFLWNEHSGELTAYEQRLMEGDSPEEAWRVAFPRWGSGRMGSLDAALGEYQRKGRGIRWEIKLGKVDRTFTATQPSAGDIHLALMELRLLARNPIVHGQVRREFLEEAWREEPGHPRVAAELARLRGTPVLPVLRGAVAARPDDGRGWYLLALEAPDAAERETALRRAVERWPQGALANAALAELLATTGRPKEALRYANRGVELAPWHPSAVSALATVAVELGQCRQALVLQSRAVEAIEAKRIGSAGQELKRHKQRLAEMEKRCPPH